MSKVGGLFLIVSGLAIAAYWMADPEHIGQQTDVTKTTITETSAPRGSLLPETWSPFWSKVPAPAQGDEFSAPIVVTVVQRPSEPRASKSRSQMPTSRDTLVRELQNGLKRVGCYEGEINATWTPATRRAMKAFLDRINASLPIEEPDVVLYTMVQSQADQVCGKPCSTGEILDGNGRCLPAVVLGNAKKKSAPEPTAVAAVTSKASPTTAASSLTGVTPGSSPAEERMSLAGPNVGPGQATETPQPPSRPSQMAARTVQPRAAVGEQRWSRAIFSPRISNN